MRWHVDRSEVVGRRWSAPVDLVFIDGDHSPATCRLDWELFSRWVTPGGVVVFHDARHGKPGGEGLPGDGGLPGPTALVDELFRAPGPVDGWQIRAELHTTVAVEREPSTTLRKGSDPPRAARMSCRRCSTGTPGKWAIRGEAARSR